MPESERAHSPFPFPFPFPYPFPRGIGGGPEDLVSAPRLLLGNGIGNGNVYGWKMSLARGPYA